MGIEKILNLLCGCQIGLGGSNFSSNVWNLFPLCFCGFYGGKNIDVLMKVWSTRELNC